MSEINGRNRSDGSDEESEDAVDCGPGNHCSCYEVDGLDCCFCNAEPSEVESPPDDKALASIEVVKRNAAGDIVSRQVIWRAEEGKGEPPTDETVKGTVQ